MSNKIKAAVAAVIAVVLTASVAVGSGWFSDVADSHPQHDDISHAAEQGWYVGHEDGTFRPDEKLSAAHLVTVFGRAYPDGITRADLATILRNGKTTLDGVEARKLDA